MRGDNFAKRGIERQACGPTPISSRAGVCTDISSAAKDSVFEDNYTPLWRWDRYDETHVIFLVDSQGRVVLARTPFLCKRINSKSRIEEISKSPLRQVGRGDVNKSNIRSGRKL